MRKPYQQPDLSLKVKEKIMSLTDAETPEELKEEFDLIDKQIEEDKNRERKATIGGWGISIASHLIILLILSTIVIGMKLVEDPAPIQFTTIEIPPPVEEKKIREISMEKVEITIESEVVTDIPVVHEMVVEDITMETENEVVSEVATAKGREEAVSASENGGAAAFMVTGAGGGASGMMGSRVGGGKDRALKRTGGSKATESAVHAGLDWFMRHQSPNGAWNVLTYQTNCMDAGPKCEPGAAQSGEEDIATTGYALLCYLGAGYDHKSQSRYTSVVRKGLEYLVSAQKADGLLGERNYEHPIAGMALAEALAMTNDPSLRVPVQKAVDIILARQLQSGGYPLGWDYTSPKDTRVDMSVTGWASMFLKSASAAGGINTGNGMEGAKRTLEEAWKATNKNHANLDVYKDKSYFPYTWSPATGEIKIDIGSKTAHDLTPAGLVIAIFTGHNAGDPMMETMANHVMDAHLPKTINDVSHYYTYYNTLGIFQVGGEKWKTWNKMIHDVIVPAQRQDGCFRGSYDVGAKWHGSDTGRLVSTAYMILSLEVYYRYNIGNKK